MLSALVFVICSASATLLEDTVKINPLSALLSQVNYLPGFQIASNQAQVVSGVPKPFSNENCPANKVLQKIEVILSKVLNDEYDKELRSNQDDNINTRRSGEDRKLILPLSKINSLKDLLENHNLQRKLRTKVTVKYELPSVEELSCKQALNQILQVLREAKLMHEYYRTCSSKDNCPGENVVDMKNAGDHNVLNTAINQGNNNAPSRFPILGTAQNSMKPNDGSQSNQDVNGLLKYLLSDKSKEVMALLKNYRTSEQINLLNDTVSKELLEKFNNIQSEPVSDGMQNLPANNKFTYQQIQNPPVETNNQNANLSDIIAEALLYQSKNPVNVNSNVDKNPDNLLVTGTNDGNVVSLFPSGNGENLQVDVTNGENTFNNVDTGVQENNIITSNTEIQKQSITKLMGGLPDNFNGNNQNVTNSNILSVLNTVKPGADYNKLLNSMLQYQLQNQQLPVQQVTGSKYQGLQPYYINGNLVMNGGKYLSPNGYTAGSVYQSPYQIGSSFNTYTTNGLNPYRYPNLNLHNNPFPLNNQKIAYQTSYLKTNPFLVNPKLTNNPNQMGQQLYTPYNLANPQRFTGVTDQSKLNLSTNNNGIVELTYMLKQPNPVVYQPVYFVKYRLPYDSFVTNLKELLVKKPHLRTEPAKLYQELIAVSNIAEVSPSLKGVGKEKLTQMVTTNGALIKTKVLKVNETLLNKQLETVQNLNSILAPSEIVNVTYSVQVNTSKQAENSENKLPPSVTDPNEINIKYLEDILNQDKSLAKDLNVVSTVSPDNKPNYDEIPNISTLR